ncbi:hypothetical protein Salat_0189100 [Sesamum alatum]|uniref:Uncharacterized protein n=1 Tax=Sesamum alatum TaxID=300844 RepID=A0AAE1YYP9_9LAMI|nr:hypothetical protein Salat_0189100 [Sesamum alatum]
MRRSYDYHHGNYYVEDSESSIDEYLECVTRTQRTPAVVCDYPEAPHAHKTRHNHPAYAEKHDHNHVKIFHGNHHHQPPELHKKVHFVKQESSTDVGRDGKRHVYEEKSIDVEAEGFIQQHHKNFELSKWDTFKVY